MSQKAPQYFNNALLRHRLSRAGNQANKPKIIEQALLDIADNFAERLSLVNRKFKHALIWGYRSELLIEALKKHNCLPNTYIAGGIINSPIGIQQVVIDQETLPFPDNCFDLVLSFCNLQWINDVPGMLAQIQMSLKPDGLFQAVLAGGDTMHEIRNYLIETELQINNGAATRTSPFMQLYDGARLMQRAQYALSVIDIDRHQLTYPNIAEALLDIRKSGLSHIPTTSPSILAKQVVHRIYSEHNKTNISLELIYMSGWRPSPCQPKPLKRGAAKRLLSEVL